MTEPGAPDPSWPTPRTDGATPETAFRVPFSILVGMGLVAWSVVAQVFVGGFAVSLGIDIDDATQLRVVIIASQVVTLVGGLWLLHMSGRLSWRLTGPVAPTSLDVLRGLGMGAAGYAIVLLWAGIFTAVFGEPAPVDQALLQDAGASTSVVVTSVLAAVLMAPVVEEILFRGVLFQAARRQLGLVGGIVLSAFVWTMVHAELLPGVGTFQPVAVGAIFLLGLWFGWVFHRSGTIVVPIVAHAVFNAVNLGVALFAA